jgi:hypothetical protein
MKDLNSAQQKSTIGLITLDSYVSLYSETMRYLATNLKRNGYSLVRIGCDGVLNTCTSLNSLGNIEITEEIKYGVCRDCKRRQSKIPGDFNFVLTKSNTHLNPDAQAFLQDVTENLSRDGVIASVIDKKFQSLALCKIAFFDFSIIHKKLSDSYLTESDIKRYISGVKDLLQILSLFKGDCRHIYFSDIIYVNGNYSQNTLIRQLAKPLEAICHSIEPQLTSQSLVSKIFIKVDRLEISPEAIHSISNKENFSRTDFKKVLKNFRARINGKDFNAYTSLSRLPVDEESKKIHAFLGRYEQIQSFFMSSEDEFVPHRETHDFRVEKAEGIYMMPFENQLEFTKFYLTQAALNPNIGFIIRMHPRMARNKRDIFESEEHIRYKKLLNGVQPNENVLIIYGDSKISSYYLISRSNLVVVTWSTIGLEALLIGAPVISIFPGYLMYPLNKFSKQPSSIEGLEEAFRGGSDFGRPKDKVLILWLSEAYEGKFFSTLAPRGSQTILGKLYQRAYRLLDKLGLYYFFYRLSENNLLGNVSQTKPNFYVKKSLTTSLRESDLFLLSDYRREVSALLNKYKSTFQN